MNVPTGFPLLEAMEERDKALVYLIFFAFLMSFIGLCLIFGLRLLK
jgi:hypothetical protein